MRSGSLQIINKSFTILLPDEANEFVRIVETYNVCGL